MKSSRTRYRSASRPSPSVASSARTAGELGSTIPSCPDLYGGRHRALRFFDLLVGGLGCLSRFGAPATSMAFRRWWFGRLVRDVHVGGGGFRRIPSHPPPEKKAVYCERDKPREDNSHYTGRNDVPNGADESRVRLTVDRDRHRSDDRRAPVRRLPLAIERVPQGCVSARSQASRVSRPGAHRSHRPLSQDLVWTHPTRPRTPQSPSDARSRRGRTRWRSRPRRCSQVVRGRSEQGKDCRRHRPRSHREEAGPALGRCIPGA